MQFNYILKHILKKKRKYKSNHPLNDIGFVKMESREEDFTIAFSMLIIIVSCVPFPINVICTILFTSFLINSILHMIYKESQRFRSLAFHKVYIIYLQNKCTEYLLIDTAHTYAIYTFYPGIGGVCMIWEKERKGWKKVRNIYFALFLHYHSTKTTLGIKLGKTLFLS